MDEKKRFLGLLAASLGLMATTALPAFAGGFAIREQSTTGLGLSFAGVAAGSGDGSSMFWNPATITDIPGIHSEWDISGIFPTADLKAVAPTPTLGLGNAGNIGMNGGLAAAYPSYQFNDNLWLGLATTSPYGLSTKTNFNWAGQVYGRSARIVSFDGTPTIGWKINDWISVGAGVTVEYINVRLTRALGILPNTPSAILEGDNVGVGYALGATFKPLPWTEIGIGFRSSIHHQLDGTLTAPPAPGFPILSLPAKANINTPEDVTLGLRQRVSPQWTLLAGLEWTNWSRLNIVPVTTLGVPATALPLQYKDGYMASVGAEYEWSPLLTFRAGLGYEWSPIDTANRQVFIPDNNRIWTSIGATYHWSEKLSFDVSYAHLFPGSPKLQIVPGSAQYVGVPFFGKADASINIVSASFKYRWDDPTKTIPVTQPIIRKD
jgi:long-chain fatty acid transport protein